MGKLNAACRPAASAVSRRENFDSFVTSTIQAGALISQVRPGPKPRLNLLARVASSNVVASTPASHQKSTQRNSPAVLSTIHIAPTCQCTDSATARSTHDAASSIVDECASASMTAYCARR